MASTAAQRAFEYLGWVGLEPTTNALKGRYPQFVISLSEPFMIRLFLLLYLLGRAFREALQIDYR
jgi:hypothetical protein